MTTINNIVPSTFNDTVRQLYNLVDNIYKITTSVTTSHYNSDIDISGSIISASVVSGETILLNSTDKTIRLRQSIELNDSACIVFGTYTSGLNTNVPVGSLFIDSTG